MTARACCVLLMTAVGCVLPALPTRAEGASLVDILAQQGAADARLPPGHHGWTIDSFSILSEPGLLVIAGYLEEPGEVAADELHVWRVDRSSGAVAHTEVDEPLGSVLAIHKTGPYLLFTLHQSPSRSTDLILTIGLQRHGVAPGATVAVLDDRHVLLLHGQVHFAPTYSAELSVYDVHALTGSPLFPPEPESPLREMLRRRYARAYADLGTTWCAKHNHHCDASRLRSRLVGPTVYSSRADALAFVISYDRTPTVEPGRGSLPALYVFRGVLSAKERDLREIPLEAGSSSPSREELAGCLEAERLEAVLKGTDDCAGDVLSPG